MANKDLIKFIKEARKRGFDDYEIREPLLKKGWALEEIEDAFASLKTKPKHEHRVCIYLDADVLRAIEKRADKNLLRVDEQIEDILRRSVINTKKRVPKEEKLDDLLVGLFSRKRYKK